MEYYIGILVAFVLVVFIWSWLRRKKIDKLIKTLEELTEKDKKIKEEIAVNQHEYDELNKKLAELRAALVSLDKERIVSIQRASEARDATERLLKSEQERVRAELRRVHEVEEQKMKHDFEAKEAALAMQYNWRKQQFEEDFNELCDFYNNELVLTKAELNEYQAKREAVNQAILRERELEEKEDFYRIIIKDTDARDIDTLRSIETHLFNKEVLNKLIYETFIKRPLIEMEKRVLGGRKIGGIYKITYIKTGESYIGRSVDIGNRWKEHCLSSLNIGTIAHSTFHNILADKGLQNFTWEVLEEVDKEKQSSREKYWIDFYQTDKQFNQKAGG